MSKYLLKSVGGVFLFVCFLAGCQAVKPENNVVVLFLGGAERQIETDDQRQELARALGDMLNLSSSQLREKRYADYQLTKGQWTLKDILHAYYVPSEPQSSFDDSGKLYADAATSASKSIVRAALEDLLPD